MGQKNYIGILSFNKINLTKRCLDSVITSGYNTGSVFLYHNGSNLEVTDQLKNTYPEINHKRSEKNSGFSGGFNRVMQWIFDARGGSVLFLTNDTIIDKFTFNNCMKTGEETGSGFITPSVYYLRYPDKIDSSGGFFDRHRFTLSHYHHLSLPGLLEKDDYIPGTALWMTREVFDKTGGMDESYHTYWEDADLSFRCHKAGIKMARSFNSKVLHGIGQTCHKKPLYTTYYFQRNRILFCRKFLSGPELETASELILKDIHQMRKMSEEKGDMKKLILISDLEKLF